MSGVGEKDLLRSHRHWGFGASLLSQLDSYIFNSFVDVCASLSADRSKQSLSALRLINAAVFFARTRLVQMDSHYHN